MTPSENAVYAITESFNTVKANLPMTFVLLIVNGIVNMIGSIPFGLGLVITIPLTQMLIAQALKEMRPDIRDQSA
jgi:uncharacterized membrane protein